MTLLFRILRAAHATGSHHKLALDALQLLAGDAAEGWRRLFLHHAGELMRGAKAPDDAFKDFKNHVLHPRDGYWGGAPEKVDEWYHVLIAALQNAQWPEAAYAAGVLSHYLVDPMHPFHTGQSEAENNIHRALEWSINRAFDDLQAIGRSAGPAPAIAIGADARGLKDLVCEGADKANKSYELMIAHYDIHAGASDPPSGLDAVSRKTIAELIVFASTAFARVLERAVAEAGVQPPEVSLTLDTIMAAIRIPAKLLAKRLADAEDRRIVLAMYDELVATGRVEKTLPEDDRVVAAAYAKEVLPARLAEQDRARLRRIDVPTPRADLNSVSVELTVAGRNARAAASPSSSPAATAVGCTQASVRQHDPLAQLQLRPATPRPPAAGSLLDRLPPPLPAAAATEQAVAATSDILAAAVARTAAVNEVRKAVATQTPREAQPRATRIHLAASDDLEAAPSIGARTAERLAVAGLRTVADLLAADPDVVAAQAGHRGIDGGTVRDWQDQARLVSTIPGLHGGGAQLLVGAGYRTVASIAAAEADKLCADVLTFAATIEGHRILREGQPPDIERIKSWCEVAKSVIKAA